VFSRVQNTPVLSRVQNSPVFSRVQNTPVFSRVQNTQVFSRVQNTPVFSRVPFTDSLVLCVLSIIICLIGHGIVCSSSTASDKHIGISNNYVHCITICQVKWFAINGQNSAQLLTSQTFPEYMLTQYNAEII
jgi:hypothetical protein